MCQEDILESGWKFTAVAQAPELLEASKRRISKVTEKKKQTHPHSIEMAQAWGAGSDTLGVDGILASVRDRSVLSRRC